MDNVPYFEIDSDTSDFNIFAKGPIQDQEGFYKRLYAFIKNNLESNYRRDLLCYFVNGEGIIMEATLDPGSYLKSLNKCIEYYREYEEYEKCNKIKKLIETHELR